MKPTVESENQMQIASIDSSESEENIRIKEIQQQGEIFGQCALMIEGLNDTFREMNRNFEKMTQSLQQTNKLTTSWLSVWKQMDTTSSHNKENNRFH